MNVEKMSTNKCETKIVSLSPNVNVKMHFSHVRFMPSKIPLRQLVSFLLIKIQSVNNRRFKGCIWTSTIGWRSPAASISRHFNHLKHEDIYSSLRSLHHIYVPLLWILTMTTCCLQSKACRTCIDKQAAVITVSHNKSKSMKPCEQSNSWSEWAVMA